jgi:ATP-dependent DNA helicase RecG
LLAAAQGCHRASNPATAAGVILAGAVAPDDVIRDSVRKVLPFSLTGAQKRVLKEIATDMQSSKPMYRLLQGDVGSGKTIVALIAALIAIRNGHQAALLAPTEILADQHFERILQLLDGSDISVVKLTGSTPASTRPRLLQRIASGDAHLVIGTHAILEPRVRFKSLGLAIVDEQHRFGVVQRQKLFDKGELPDILVMTATPIPRSLAIAMYGDLELSVIDELPPGREPIRTYVRGTSQMPKVFRFIEEQISEGAQAYVVYPIIEESEKLDLKPLLAGVEHVKELLPGRRIGILHGRMKSEEKDDVMRRFKAGRLDVLVSTTVVEVGVDVPNASVMLILDADRFGLAQMHQLRGRVGRGSRKSYCILLRDETATEESKQRLEAFSQTNDGFAVAERDLEIRGAGDFFGTRQSGLPKFRFGNLLRHHSLMELARKTAIEVVERDGVKKGVELLRRLDPAAFAGPAKKD